MKKLLEDLYKSEINCSISTFWDGGWDVSLGDEMNGFKAQSSFESLDEVCDALTKWAVEFYPDSDFARPYK